MQNVVIFCFNVFFPEEINGILPVVDAFLSADNGVLKAFVASLKEAGSDFGRYRSLTSGRNFCGHDILSQDVELPNVGVRHGFIQSIRRYSQIRHVFIVSRSPKWQIEKGSDIQPFVTLSELDGDSALKRQWNLRLPDALQAVQCT